MVPDTYNVYLRCGTHRPTNKFARIALAPKNKSKGGNVLKKVSKDVFMDMTKKGFLKPRGREVYHYITGKSKGKSARKKHYVCEPVLERYLRHISRGG